MLSEGLFKGRTDDGAGCFRLGIAGRYEFGQFLQALIDPFIVDAVGNQLQIAWPDGTLQSATNAAGPYVDVPGNPTSPLLVSPTEERVFYRSRR